jgi:hypothetical protein
MADKTSTAKIDLLRLYLLRNAKLKRAFVDTLLKPEPALTLSGISKAMVLDLINRGFSVEAISNWQPMIAETAKDMTIRLMEEGFSDEARANSAIQSRIIEPMQNGHFTERCVTALQNRWVDVIAFYRSKLPSSQVVARFTNDAEGIEVIVTKRQADFTIAVRDLRTGAYSPTILIDKDEQEALNKAKKRAGIEEAPGIDTEKLDSEYREAEMDVYHQIKRRAEQAIRNLAPAGAQNAYLQGLTKLFKEQGSYSLDMVREGLLIDACARSEAANIAYYHLSLIYQTQAERIYLNDKVLKRMEEVNSASVGFDYAVFKHVSMFVQSAAKSVTPEIANQAAPLSEQEQQAWRETGATAADIKAIREAGGYAAILADAEKRGKFGDTLDNIITQRLLSVRSVLHDLGWSASDARSLVKGGYRIYLTFNQTGAGRNVIGYAINNIQDTMTVPAADFAKIIDTSVFPDKQEDITLEMTPKLIEKDPYFFDESGKLYHSRLVKYMQEVLLKDSDEASLIYGIDDQDKLIGQKFIATLDSGKIARAKRALQQKGSGVTVYTLAESNVTVYVEAMGLSITQKVPVPNPSWLINGALYDVAVTDTKGQVSEPIRYFEGSKFVRLEPNYNRIHTQSEYVAIFDHDRSSTRIAVAYDELNEWYAKNWIKKSSLGVNIVEMAIENVKTRFSLFKSIEVPDNWIIMNAARPLLGHETVSDGTFLSGRFYAGINPEDGFAVSYIRENIKLDAIVVLQASMSELIEMALAENEEYRAAYEEMEPERQQDALRVLISKLNDRPYKIAVKMLEKARAKLSTNAEEQPQVPPDSDDHFFTKVWQLLKAKNWTKQPNGTWRRDNWMLFFSDRVKTKEPSYINVNLLEGNFADSLGYVLVGYYAKEKLSPEQAVAEIDKLITERTSRMIEQNQGGSAGNTDNPPDSDRPFFDKVAAVLNTLGWKQHPDLPNTMSRNGWKVIFQDRVKVKGASYVIVNTFDRGAAKNINYNIEMGYYANNKDDVNRAVSDIEAKITDHYKDGVINPAFREQDRKFIENVGKLLQANGWERTQDIEGSEVTWGRRNFLLLFVNRAGYNEVSQVTLEAAEDGVFKQVLTLAIGVNDSEEKSVGAVYAALQYAANMHKGQNDPEQKLYRPFDPSEVRMPQPEEFASVFEIEKRIKLLEGSIGWTNSHILEHTQGMLLRVEKFVKNNVHGELARVPRQRWVSLLEKAESNATVRLEPIAVYDNKSYILSDERRIIATAAAKTYYDYFATRYPRAEFYSNQQPGSSILVKNQGKSVGIIMPVGLTATREEILVRANEAQKLASSAEQQRDPLNQQFKTSVNNKPQTDDQVDATIKKLTEQEVRNFINSLVPPSASFSADERADYEDKIQNGLTALGLPSSTVQIIMLRARRANEQKGRQVGYHTNIDANDIVSTMDSMDLLIFNVEDANPLRAKIFSSYEQANEGDLSPGLRKTAEAMYKALINKDVDALMSILYPENRISRRAFELLFDDKIKLSRTIKMTRRQVEDIIREIRNVERTQTGNVEAQPAAQPQRVLDQSVRRDIANTILAQLGSNRFAAMTGAKDFTALEAGGLQFSLPKKLTMGGINKVQILLNSDDTYTVKFWKIYRKGLVYHGTEGPVRTETNVTSNSLRSIFTQVTGLATSL